MVKNYFIIAFRNLINNRSSSFICIGGLAIGMSVAMFICLWVYDELSYNTYHKNYDRIAQVRANAGYSGEEYTIESRL